ncbi:hypothetical protein PMAYCL1PPCAC_25424, partial [Pristionchus mayeri]
LNEVEKYLTQTKGIDVSKKLLYAEQYNLTSLKDYCLTVYPRISLFEKLKSSPDYDNFSEKIKADMEAVIEYKSPDTPIDLSKFCPNGMGNVTLIIGEKKLRVSKDYLEIHSPVFEALFFGDFAEKGKEEVEIKDVVYEEFLDVLQLIYLRSLKIRDLMVPHLLKLGDQFQMECVLNLSEKCLI